MRRFGWRLCENSWALKLVVENKHCKQDAGEKYQWNRLLVNVIRDAACVYLVKSSGKVTWMMKQHKDKGNLIEVTHRMLVVVKWKVCVFMYGAHILRSRETDGVRNQRKSKESRSSTAVEHHTVHWSALQWRPILFLALGKKFQKIQPNQVCEWMCVFVEPENSLEYSKRGGWRK